jgi:hypothetical protein
MRQGSRILTVLPPQMLERNHRAILGIQHVPVTTVYTQAIVSSRSVRTVQGERIYVEQAHRSYFQGKLSLASANTFALWARAG